MFASFERSRGDPGEERDPEQRPRRRKPGPRIPLPSPLLLGVICLFVVLPLAWPESDDPSAGSHELASFELSADVTSAALSVDGQTLAATCRDRPVAFWRHAATSWSRYSLPLHQPNGTRVLAISPAGDVLATGNVDGSVALWDLGSDVPRATIPIGKDMVLCMTFSPNGSLLAAASADSDVKLLDVTEGRVRQTLAGHRGSVSTLTFFPDGRSLASGGDDGLIVLWDVENGRETARLQGSSEVVLSLSVSAGGVLMASSSLCDHRIRLWDLETMEARGCLPTEGASTTCLIFPADGGYLVSADERGWITFWDLALGKPRSSFRAHDGWVKSLSLSLQGQALASGGNDGRIRIWGLDVASRAHPAAAR